MDDKKVKEEWKDLYLPWRIVIVLGTVIFTFFGSVCIFSGYTELMEPSRDVNWNVFVKISAITCIPIILIYYILLFFSIRRGSYSILKGCGLVTIIVFVILIVITVYGFYRRAAI